MKSFLLIAATIFVVSGCTQPESYPVSGEECGPNDPVLDMTVPGCIPGIQ